MKTKPPKAKKHPRTRARARSRTKPRAKHAEQRGPDLERENTTSELLRELSEHTGVSPADTGGDVDADWQRAQSSGEEAVGARWRTEHSTDERARYADEP
jgi:Family of unknown function (DUF6335)